MSLRFSILRHHVASRILVLVLAAQMFNLSMDAADRLEFLYPEDTTVNEIESFVEFVLEEILLLDNAIGEEDDCDQDKASIGLLIVLVDSQKSIYKKLFPIRETIQQIPERVNLTTPVFYIATPPPKF